MRNGLTFRQGLEGISSSTASVRTADSTASSLLTVAGLRFRS
jgi:hypothetical protein